MRLNWLLPMCWSFPNLDIWFSVTDFPGLILTWWRNRETVISTVVELLLVEFALFLSGWNFIQLQLPQGTLCGCSCFTINMFTNTKATNNFLVRICLTVWSVSAGLYCDLSVDGIGTCWPRSAAGELISRPCPEQFNGIHYNTTSQYLSTCLSTDVSFREKVLC